MVILTWYDKLPRLCHGKEFTLSTSSYKRTCSREKDFDPLANSAKQICLPIEPEEYNRILPDAQAFRQYLDRTIIQHSELFSEAIHQRYTLHDVLPESQKMPGIRFGAPPN